MAGRRWRMKGKGRRCSRKVVQASAPQTYCGKEPLVCFSQSTADQFFYKVQLKCHSNIYSESVSSQTHSYSQISSGGGGGGGEHCAALRGVGRPGSVL